MAGDFYSRVREPDFRAAAGCRRQAPALPGRSATWAARRAQVMAEVMAKSKAARAAQREQRAEDLDATDKVDADFAALLAGGGLAGLVPPRPHALLREPELLGARQADCGCLGLARERPHTRPAPVLL
jgi:hypothetical protein